ncbi:uncharacterized protein PHACADRAFT_202910 [Phanerochaete carnosa HHB-10118-sp]|uniref:Uncharacterized protein n=1 Tax=Phanerochaete carnosa (strain HHB-10118-sp) TaxID=650164 RepID=K5VP81_PHACS|nr:uncharacterized protein PHACADRAFT_202910 [Phanerochaete carnosa HHB-10118-sp]EKM48364.1 hypothetical protein PHACADRAFT_202910 [Phanerochaete carnosa HHB-10118-sp]
MSHLLRALAWVKRSSQSSQVTSYIEECAQIIHSDTLPHTAVYDEWHSSIRAMTDWCIFLSIRKGTLDAPELKLLSDHVGDRGQPISTFRKALNIRARIADAAYLYTPCTSESANLFCRLSNASPEAIVLPSVFALVLRAECEYFSNLATEASSNQELLCQARTRALKAFSLRWKVPAQLDDAETWRSFLAATGSNDGAKRPVLRAISVDILLLILRNGRRVQWDMEHKGFSELNFFRVSDTLGY